MKLKYTLLFSLGLTVILLFVSCQSKRGSTIATSPAVSATNTVMSQPSLALTTTVPQPTATAVVKVETTSDPIPDFTVSATIAPETVMPLPTLVTPTIAVVTLTPLPTFAADELETAMAELLANPMNCDVPCWWGAVPNETTVFEIQQFLALYQLTDYKHDDNQIPDYIELWFGYDKNANQFDFRIMYSFQNDILKSIIAEHSPPLHEILRKYGEPNEIWLSTVSFIREGDLLVRLNMVYLQEGMAIGYVVNGSLHNDIVAGCFFDRVGLLSLDIPNSTTSYKDFTLIFEEDRRYLPLEEATDLTMESFMQQFSDPTQPQCIETPAELWD